MSRKNSTALVWLVLFGAIAYPFVWLLQHIGLFGFLGLAALLTSGWFFLARKRGRADRQNFEQLVRYVFDNRLPPDEARQINTRLARAGEKAQLIRHLQILRDSTDIFSTSLKPDTAESRFELALEKYHAALRILPRFVSTDTITHIEKSFTRSAYEFQTKKFTNPASALIAKSKTLKTTSARTKRLEEARAILLQGLAAQESDKFVIGGMRDDVDKLLSELHT